MVLVCHIILGFPRRGCHWLFSRVQYIVQTTLFKAVGNMFPAYFQGILSDFLRDVRTALDKFNLDAKATIRAVCPKCQETYPPQCEGDIPVYRERCNARHRGTRRGELLVRPKLVQGIFINVPIKPYVAFDVKDWVARLLSRKGFEEVMDKTWNKMNIPVDGKLEDILQGSVIRELEGRDGAHFATFRHIWRGGHWAICVFTFL